MRAWRLPDSRGFQAAAEIYAKAARMALMALRCSTILHSRFKAGNPAEAIAAFERAELRGGTILIWRAIWR